MKYQEYDCHPERSEGTYPLTGFTSVSSIKYQERDCHPEHREGAHPLAGFTGVLKKAGRSRSAGQGYRGYGLVIGYRCLISNLPVWCWSLFVRVRKYKPEDRADTSRRRLLIFSTRSTVLP